MKRILLIISITFFTLSVEAQKKAIFGIIGGTNFSNITSENIFESNRKVGVYLGFLMEIPISDLFSLQSELLYATYGADLSLRTVPWHLEIEYDFDYIQIPLIGKINPYPNISLEIGPSFNLLVREKGYIPGLPDIVDEDGNFIRNQTDLDSNANKFELSGLVGVSYKLNKSWAVSARYTQGFTNIFGDAKNNAFQFGLRYIL